MDHPRSRGVYGLMQYTPAWNEGSSPLARGLHAIVLALVVGKRIIPARAGFTEGHTWEFPYGHGSSPLARGLHPETNIPAREVRIIPARAGFTPGSRSR